MWQESLWEEMREAGEEERRLAVSNGDVDGTGMPFITVLVDGGWSKRSYGHTYNAASGAVRNTEEKSRFQHVFICLLAHDIIIYFL